MRAPRSTCGGTMRSSRIAIGSHSLTHRSAPFANHHHPRQINLPSTPSLSTSLPPSLQTLCAALDAGSLVATSTSTRDRANRLYPQESMREREKECTMECAQVHSQVVVVDLFGMHISILRHYVIKIFPRQLANTCHPATLQPLLLSPFPPSLLASAKNRLVCEMGGHWVPGRVARWKNIMLSLVRLN